MKLEIEDGENLHPEDEGDEKVEEDISTCLYIDS